MNRIVIAITAILLLIGSAVAQERPETPPELKSGPPHAEQGPKILQKPVPCAPVDKILSELKKYEEVPSVILKTVQNTMIITFMNLETHTWTVIEVGPDGQSACVLGNGSGKGTYDLNKKYLQNLLGIMVKF